MIAEYTGTIPKRGDRVGTAHQEGVFEVVDLNSLMPTAPETALKFPNRKQTEIPRHCSSEQGRRSKPSSNPCSPSRQTGNTCQSPPPAGLDNLRKRTSDGFPVCLPLHISLSGSRRRENSSNPAH